MLVNIWSCLFCNSKTVCIIKCFVVLKAVKQTYYTVQDTLNRKVSFKTESNFFKKKSVHKAIFLQLQHTETFGFLVTQAGLKLGVSGGWTPGPCFYFLGMPGLRDAEFESKASHMLRTVPNDPDAFRTEVRIHYFILKRKEKHEQRGNIKR